MIRKTALFASLATAGLLAAATPAFAGGTTTTHVHFCNCGHPQGAAMCGTTTGGTTTTSGGTTTTSGGTTTTSGGTTTTSGGTTSTTSGGTSVPEPGMLGLLGLGLVGVGVARRRQRRG